jgi:hypothetical protein
VCEKKQAYDKKVSQWLIQFTVVATLRYEGTEAATHQSGNVGRGEQGASLLSRERFSHRHTIATLHRSNPVPARMLGIVSRFWFKRRCCKII